MAVLYRIIKYEGPRGWIDRTLDNSIQGVKECNPGTVTAVTVDPADARTIEFCRDRLRRLNVKVGERIEGEGERYLVQIPHDWSRKRIDQFQEWLQTHQVERGTEIFEFLRWLCIQESKSKEERKRASDEQHW